MFTGIIEHVGAVRGVRTTGDGARLTVDLGPLAEGLRGGDSVAVSGACLTAAALRGAEADFDVVTETLERTTLGALRAGARVNLERPLALGDRLHGHLVQGHVDGVATVRRVRTAGEWLVELDAPQALTQAMVPKGSVALDGVSLTVVDAGATAFSVALIPTTRAATTLGGLAAGDRANVETDLIGKYVRRYLSAGGQPTASAGGLTLDRLREAGFA